MILSMSRKKITLWGLAFLAVVVIVVAALFVAVPSNFSSHPTSQAHSANVGITFTPTSKPTLTPTPQPLLPSVYNSMSNGDINMLDDQGSSPHSFKNIPLSADNTDNFITDVQQLGNILYIHTPNSNTDNIFAINADTGAQLWSYHQGNECAVQSPPYSAPLYSIVGNVYYVISSNASGPTNCSWSDQNVIALDSKTGKKLWGSPHTAFLGASTSITLIYDGKSIYGLEAKTGKQIWTSPGNGILHYLMNDSAIYIGGYSIFALDLQNGSELWQIPTAYEIYPEVIIDNDLVLLNPVYNNKIVFMRIHAGKIVWTIPGSYSGNAIDSSIQLSGNQLVELSNNTHTPVIQVLNKNTGAIESHYTPSQQQAGTACWDHSPNDSRAYFTPNEDVFGGSDTNESNQAFSIEAIDIGTSPAPVWSRQFMGVMTICYALGNFVTISTYDHSVPDLTPQSGPSDSGPAYKASGPYYTYLLNAHDGSIIWKQATNTWTVFSVIDAR